MIGIPWAAVYRVKIFNIPKKDLQYAHDHKRVFFFKKCIVYPFVQHTLVKDGIVVSDTELCEIVDFLQSTGMCAL